jgi:uncharacterized membrane protein
MNSTITPSSDLLTVVLLSSASAWISSQPTGPLGVQMLLGLFLVLVCPGYALSAVLFPRTILRLSERILLTTGLSLAICVIGGFLLHMLPVGMDATSWQVLLVTTTLMCCVLAFWRRCMTHHQRLTVNRKALRPINLSAFIMMSVSLLLFAGAIQIARSSEMQMQEGVQFTQFWILPYELVFIDDMVRVGIANHESDVQYYRLEVKNDNRVVHARDNIRVAPGEHWQHVVVLPPAPNGERRVEATLYRNDDDRHPYRQVFLVQ